MSKLSKIEVIEALRVTTKLVKLVRAEGQREQLIEPDQALKYYKLGRFEARGGTKRIKAIVEIESPRRMWQRCYRNAEAPVLQPSIEYLRGLNSAGV